MRRGEGRRPRTRAGDAWAAAPWLAALLAAWLVPAAAQQPSAPPGDASSQSAEAAGAPPRARVIEIAIGQAIEPVLAEYVTDGMDQAIRERARLILITMDTPGGLQTSMQDIIQRILSSPVPVAVYISPTGARGASAGFFILLAADIAAMTPGTHTGAASPLLAVGGVPVNVDETVRNKILNDATAYLRSYAEQRGRNVAVAETAVTEGKAFTDTEALENRLIDLIAESPEQLLERLNGRDIRRFDGSMLRLELDDPERIAVGMTARQRFLSRIVQPDAFFILLILGVLGLYIEFNHPGLILPGVVGAISLILALFAMNILPVNFAGVLLIVAALVLFVLEAMYASSGILAAGGVAAMLLGAMMLIRSPLTGFRVSLGVALGVTLPAAALTVLMMRMVLRSRRWRASVGTDLLVGASAEVTEPLVAAPDGSFRGMVRLEGELWRAVATQAIPAGARVRVERVDGLTLHVVPAGAGEPPKGSETGTS